MREYLAEIFRLQHQGLAVTTSALAERLDVSPPAVVKTLRRLHQAGYVLRKPYAGVFLTSPGEREAVLSIRRHRLLEAFLVNVMGFGWDEVHEQADRLEPAIDDAFEDRMDAVAGYPVRCPHGDPIPTKEGVMPEVHDVSLVELEPGAHGILRRVKAHDPEKLRYLAELELVPGAPLQVVSRGRFNGPVRLAVGGREHVLGVELARELYVEQQVGQHGEPYGRQQAVE
jgi:DtxR family Mn-dependent transcriptional regulator